MKAFNYSIRVPLLSLVVLVLAAGLLAPSSFAAKYPSKPITIIYPFAVGGGAGPLLREIADQMEKEFGVGVTVVNKPGAGGAVGWTELAAAKPDGHTLGYVSTSLVFKTYLGVAKLDYRNYEPIGMFTFNPCSVTVKADSPWKTLKEFIDYAREHPNEVRVSNGGSGSSWHIAALSFAKETGLRFRHIPYQGGAKAKVALAGGHVEATFVSPSEVNPLVQAGKLRMLAVGSDLRNPYFPDIPTVKELGVNFSFGIWNGLIAPKGTPADTIAKIAKLFKKAVLSDSYRKIAKNIGYAIVFLDTEDFRKKINEDGQRLKPVMEELKKVGK